MWNPLEPPGPIDNSGVLRFNKSTSTYTVETNSDYGWISMDTWLFFHGIYGGGPAHNIGPTVVKVNQGDSKGDDENNCKQDINENDKSGDCGGEAASSDGDTVAI